MEYKTILKKGEHSVTIITCNKVIDGIQKNFRIEGTEQYFVRQRMANMAANQLLLKKFLSEADFAKRKEVATRKRNAVKVINVYNCFKETDSYIKKWSGILYLETKKNLHSELQRKLDDTCKKYKFENVNEAIHFIQKNTKI